MRGRHREGLTMQGTTTVYRPRLTSAALVRWGRPLLRHSPWLLSAMLVPGRLPPRTREAAMLGVTSINRCEACERSEEHTSELQ